MDESVMVIFEICSKEVKIVSEKYTNELDCATELRIWMLDIALRMIGILFSFWFKSAEEYLSDACKEAIVSSEEDDDTDVNAKLCWNARMIICACDDSVVYLKS